MLRRDLLKGLAGLLLGGKILSGSEQKENSNTVTRYLTVKNEYRMETLDEVNPGDRLYYDLKDGGRITKNNTGHPIGIATSTKDEYNCCNVSIYL